MRKYYLGLKFRSLKKEHRCECLNQFPSQLWDVIQIPFTHLNCRKVPIKSYTFSFPANLGCELWRGQLGRHHQHITFTPSPLLVLKSSSLNSCLSLLQIQTINVSVTWAGGAVPMSVAFEAGSPVLTHGRIHGLSKCDGENWAFLQRASCWFLAADATEGRGSGEVLIQENKCVQLKIKHGIS